MAAKIYPSTVADRFVLRMPNGMRPEIKRKAAENQRTMNAEIIFLIKKGMGTRNESQSPG